MMKSLMTTALVAATIMTAACAKKTGNNTDANIQKVLDQINADNQTEIDRVKSEFDQIQNDINQITSEADRQSDDALAAVQKTTFNYVNKMVRVDILNDSEQVQKSYLDFFELDPTSGSYKSKFENLFYMDGAGICINLASLVCETTYSLQKLAQRMGTVNGGRFKMTDTSAAQFSNIPDITYKGVSKVVRLESDFMILELKSESILVNAATGSSTPGKKIKISTLGKLSHEKHNFFQLTEDKPDRKDLAVVDSDLKKLSLSTVQIMINSEGGSMLHGSASGHGTGFFISNDGLMLTNNHVADGLVDCMDFHKCQVSLKQIDSENKVSNFTVDAQLLVTDVAMDFALLKVSVPGGMRIEKFELEDQEVDSSLMTLGYPGDRGQNRESTPLSYSFGKLVGTLDLGYTTSVYIAGGASGSALINLKNKKVVAIVSNGNGAIPGEDGAPGIARPIQMINAKYGIDDYLNGSKEARIAKTLQMLKVSSNIFEASKALEVFDNERSNLGLGVIKSIMLSHQDIAVRKVIMQYLEKRGFILGPDEA